MIVDEMIIPCQMTIYPQTHRLETVVVFMILKALFFVAMIVQAYVCTMIRYGAVGWYSLNSSE
jgi:hypothetical protein